MVRRFSAALDALVSRDERIGVAVSGGPDSLAMLLLAKAARPDDVEAATVDHRLRPTSADEAAMVAELCAKLNCPHATLKVDWPRKPSANLQAKAREARYALLHAWAEERRLPVILTAHHADDQAETLLMRLARGAGLSGLVGARQARVLGESVRLVRPLLGWRKAELAAIVARAGLHAVDDPTNRDPRHDRSRMRAVLGEADWADPLRLSASAGWLAEADEALDWATANLVAARLKGDARSMMIDPWGIPRELRRRLLLAAFQKMGAPTPRGPDIARVLDSLDAGRTVTLSGLKLEGGERWHLSPAPPRRAR